MGLTALWGLTFVAVKEAVERLPVFTFLTLRFALASLSLAILAALRRGRSGEGSFVKVAPAGLLTGGFLFLGYAFQTAGLTMTSASRAGFITGLSVTLVPLLEAAILRRRPDRFAVFGVLMVVAGLGLMFLDVTDLGVRRGDLLVLACALAFAAHVTAISHLGRRHEALRFTLWQTLAVSVLSVAMAAREGWRGEGLVAPVLWTLLLTGVVVSGAGLVVQVWGQRHTTATHAAVIFSLEPVFAAVAAIWLGGEHLAARVAGGGALIVAGMLVAEAGRHGLGDAGRLRPAASGAGGTAACACHLTRSPGPPRPAARNPGADPI